MTAIPAHLRRSVRQRAGDRCEYCLLAQKGQEATFHIDHIIPVVKGGATILTNLALACVSCSLRKGHRQTAVDADSDEFVRLFNPRQDCWDDHFEWQKFHPHGRTATGRATVAALKLNKSKLVNIRKEQQLLGRHPPT